MDTARGNSHPAHCTPKNDIHDTVIRSEVENRKETKNMHNCKKIICKNDICLTVAHNHSTAYKKSISLSGVVTLKVEMGNKWLTKSKTSIEQLPEGLSHEVRNVLGREAANVIRKAKESIVPLTSSHNSPLDVL